MLVSNKIGGNFMNKCLRCVLLFIGAFLSAVMVGYYSFHMITSYKYLSDLEIVVFPFGFWEFFTISSAVFLFLTFLVFIFCEIKSHFLSTNEQHKQKRQEKKAEKQKKKAEKLEKRLNALKKDTE